MWSPQAGGSDPVRSVNWAGTFDPSVLLEELKSKPQDAVIEQIATGSMLRVMLLPSFHQITVMLSGIQCPSIRRGEDGNEDAAPFAREARFLPYGGCCRRGPADDPFVRCDTISV